VHDLTYELDLLGHGLLAKLNILERKSSYYNSDALVCVSNNTKKDLLKVYPDLNSRCKIEVIHHGFISSLGGDNKLPLTLNLSNPFYLFIGRREGYKNFKVVTESFYESLVWKDGYKLVCTGTYFTQKEIAMIKGFGLDKHVISVGNLSGISLQSLYSNAIALLYVSKYEGFGLPLLEAMKFGCPIITSNCSCMPEVVDDAAILVDPYNVGDISNAIISILDTKIQVRYKSLGYERVKKFSWESSIMKYKELYKEILS
jgi:mannosyltransferase